MSGELSLDWWRERWSGPDKPHWHLEINNPILIRNLHHLADCKPKDAGLLFIPLCGKSLDLKYLYDQGFTVLGVECSEKPVREFFKENKLEFQVKTDDRIGDVFSTPDARLRIVCGDILKLSQEVMGGPAQMVWDRGALVAVDKEMRKSYAKVMKKVVAPGAKYLLDTLHYSDWYYSGPPRNVPPKLIESLFDDYFDIQLLEQIDVSQRLQRLGVSPVHENIHLMTVKGGKTA